VKIVCPNSLGLLLLYGQCLQLAPIMLDEAILVLPVVDGRPISRSSSLDFHE
jgi:hypothetical protein